MTRRGLEREGDRAIATGGRSMLCKPEEQTGATLRVGYRLYQRNTASVVNHSRLDEICLLVHAESQLNDSLAFDGKGSGVEPAHSL